MSVSPAHYESEDGVFNLPLFIYDSLRDLMKSEFDQIRSVIHEEEEADRVVRLIKNRYQDVWSKIGMSMFKLGLVEPCDCSPKQKCFKCQGAQWIMTKGLDYDALAARADVILRDALTRRMQQADKAGTYAAVGVELVKDEDEDSDQTG